MNTQVVFFDSQVEQHRALYDHLGGALDAQLDSNTERVVLDLHTDGLAQIALYLLGRTGLHSIHIVSHGSAGSLCLGNTVVSGGSLVGHAPSLRAIGQALAPGGDILLYGCNVAAGETGLAFIGALAAITGANVAASADATGATARGGHAALEVGIGGVTVAPLFTQSTLDRLDVLLGTLPATVLPNTGALWQQTNLSGDFSQNGTITNSTEVLRIEFVPNESGNHTFTIPTSALNSQFRVYGANGDPISPIVDAFTFLFAETVTLSLTEGSPVQIAVTGSGASTGAFTFSVDGPSANTPDLIPTAPTFSNTWNFNISPQGDIDYWRLVAPAGTTSLNLSVAPTGFDSVFALFNSSGVFLQEINNGGVGQADTLVNLGVTAGATMFLGVQGVTRTSAGSYAITLDYAPDQSSDNGDPPASVTPLTGTLMRLNPFGDVSVNGDIASSAEFDVYAFHVETAGSHAIRVTGAVDAQLRVYGDNGAALTSIANSSGAGGTEGAVIPFSAAAGWVYVAVGGTGSSTGSYTVSVDGPTYVTIEPIPTPAPSFTGALNGISSVSPAGDVDYYSITAPSGTSSLNLSVTPQTGLDTVVQLYNSSGVLLQSIDNGGNGTVDISTNIAVTAGSSYFVGVSGFTRTMTGAYDIAVDFNPDAAADQGDPPATVTPLTGTLLRLNPFGDVNFNGSIASTAEFDVYAFHVETAGNHVIDVNGTFDTQLRVYDASGNALTGVLNAAGNGGTESTTLNFSAAAGWIYAVVGGVGSGTGTYNFAVNGPTYQIIEPIPTPAPSFTGAINGISSVSPGGDVDYYSITAPSGTSSLNVTVTPQAGLDSQVQLFNSSGALLQTIDTGGTGGVDSATNIAVTAGSTFFVGVSGATRTTTGSYDVSVDFSPDQVVADTTPPTVANFTPFDEATGVAVASNISLSFSENIQRGSGNILLRKADTGAIVESYPAASAAQISIAGNVLTLNPVADLQPGTGYRVDFDAGSVKDLAGNPYAGITNYNFATGGAAPDTTPPTVQSFTPAVGATGVTPASNIVLNFSEAIQRGAGTIVLRNAAGTAIETFAAASAAQISIAGNVLTLNPSADLGSGAGYRVDFDFGSVKDLAGNSFAGTTTYNFTTATAADTTPPTVTSSSPADEATGVAVGSNIVLNFSEAIQRGAGNVVLRTAAGAAIETFAAASAAQISIAGNELTLNPSADLAFSTGYRVDFDFGTVKDLTGNSYAGTITYNFSTSAALDNIPPTVQSFSPAIGATGVIPTSNIVLNFSEAIQRGAGNIVLRDAAGTAIETFAAASAAQISIAGNVLTLNPSADLAAGAGYRVDFDFGSVKDLAGNVYVGTTTYSFATAQGADTTPPTAQSFSPAAGSSGVAVSSNIVVNFSEAIARGTGTIVLRDAAGAAVETWQAATAAQLSLSGSTLTINPSSDLSAGTGYRVDFDFGSVKDTAGNAYAGTTTYNFTTTQGSDTTPPTVQSFSPANQATGVPLSGNIVVSFSETIQGGSGNIVLRNANGTLIESFNAGSKGSRATISGNTLIIDPTSDLVAGTGYRVDFDLGAVKDQAGNAYAGTTSYNFSTATATGSDTTPPTVQSFSPADEASGVAVGSNIVLAFNENIQGGSGSISLRNANGTLIETFSVGSKGSRVTISGSKLSIDPTADLAAGTGYRVDFDVGSVKDLAGNAYAGTTTYNFTTAGGSSSTTPTPGDDVLTGTAGSDAINALAGRDRINAGDGNDIVDGGPGADYIDGGTGSDTATFPLQRGDYLFSRNSNGVVTVQDKFGTLDTLVNVESVQTASGTVATSAIPYLPTFDDAANSSTLVFRFYNDRDKAFFYTANVAERDFIIQQSTDPAYTPSDPVWPYFYQGSTFEQGHSSAGTLPVYRFYNTATGHHFFTTSEAEREFVFRESTDPSYGAPGPLWPFNFEGVAFQAYGGPGHPDSQTVFRFYSPTLDRHFFTASADEAQQIRLTGVWNDEGVGFYGEVPG